MYLRASSLSTMLIVSAIFLWSMLSIVCGSANFSTSGEIAGCGPPAGAVTVTAGSVAGSADWAEGDAVVGASCWAAADSAKARRTGTARASVLVRMAARRLLDLHERGGLGQVVPALAGRRNAGPVVLALLAGLQRREIDRLARLALGQ